MTDPEAEPVVALLGRFHAAFAAGDAAVLASLFADDARLLLLHREAIDGREAILGYWEPTFARLDTSAWVPRTELIEVHGDRAYTFSTYTERLHNREDGSRQLVRGRLIHFLRCDAEGAWRIWLLMNSHSHPVEPLP